LLYLKRIGLRASFREKDQSSIGLEHLVLASCARFYRLRLWCARIFRRTRAAAAAAAAQVLPLKQNPDNTAMLFTLSLSVTK
jgi:hypothetical protein